jgi:hypothetical protein
MATLTVEQRIEELERQVAELQQKLAAQQAPAEPWWMRISGSFKDEPAFAEVIKYGREFREADRPPDEEEVEP